MDELSVLTLRLWILSDTFNNVLTLVLPDVQAVLQITHNMDMRVKI